jgi:hypothetical protein
MKRSTAVILTAAATVCATGGLLLALELVNGRHGFAATTAAQPLGWLMPIVAGLTIALVSVVLLGRTPPGARDHREPRIESCSHCGRRILDDSRLCPYCGDVLDAGSLEPRPAGEATATTTTCEP